MQLCVSRYYPNGITGKDNKERGSVVGLHCGTFVFKPFSGQRKPASHCLGFRVYELEPS